MRLAHISKSENILPATKYPSIHTFGCSLNGKAIRVAVAVVVVKLPTRQNYLIHQGLEKILYE